jgi:hypothetical protein
VSDQETQKIIDSIAQASRSRMGQMSPEKLDQGWDCLEQALANGRVAKVRVLPTVRRWWVPCFALAAAGLLVVGLYRLGPAAKPAPLHYVVEGAALGPGDAIQTTADTPARLIFSDESKIAVGPSTQVAVASVGPHGSRIALADGALDVDVHHLPGAAWRFDAGPFSVNVIGTAFRLAFDSKRGRLGLQMRSGKVEVHGPTADRVTALRAGESVELFASPIPPVPSTSESAIAPSAPLADPTAAAAPAEEPLPEPVARSPRRRSGHSEGPEIVYSATGVWPRLIAAGDFAAVVRDAQQHGLDSVLAAAPATDLNALADAARYTRRNDLARQSLLALRARFAGTPRASDAAFFLGRLAESADVSNQAAIRWYDTYLAESPRGPYSGEALGREVSILARTDRARGRAAAASYLERFPHGPEADLARSLVAPAR